jgi:DNA-binding LacI/PurR family transcriptional regulator
MTSIIDVAKAAGVSKSTVSRLVSGNGYVSAESRAKITAAMKALNYTPNHVARNLRAGATKTIGFLAQSYFGPLGVFLNSFITIAKQYNYYVTLYFTDGDQQKEIEALNELKNKQLDGIFLLTRANEWEIIEPYSTYGPLATWHRIDSPNIYSSYIDHYPGYYRSLEYLAKQGYQKIAHVLGNPENLNTQAREKAINDFYQTHNLPFKKEWVIYDDYAHHSGRHIAQRWEKALERPAALAFYNDHVAAEFISELENLGYSVPEDVAVIGFDNSYVSELMHITTVDYSIQHQAENSFIYIYNQLNQTNLPEKKQTVRLIKRKTTSNNRG